MIVTIIEGLIIIFVIAAIVRSEPKQKNEVKFRTSVREVIFPLHALLQKAILNLVKHRGAVAVIWFLFVPYLIIIPAYIMDNYIFTKSTMPTVAILIFIYLGIGWMFMIVPPKTTISLSTDLGEAHFLNERELSRHNLLQENGIIFGKLGNRFVARASEEEGNVAIFGGTGTGKTASNLIPTIATFEGTGLVIDTKLELLKKTGHLHPNKKIIDLQSPSSFYIDPLASIETYTDVVDLAKTIIPINPRENENYFKESAQNILASAFFEFKDKDSFSDICIFLTSNPINAIIDHLSSSDKDETKILINTVAGIKDSQLSSIMNELRNAIVLYATDPILKQLTGKQGELIAPDNLETDWIYILLPEKKLKIYKNVLSLIVSQFMKHLSERDEKKYPHILIGLDEFTRLGYMPTFLDSITSLRARNVTCMILLQSLAQLEQLYGVSGSKIIMDNMHYTLVYNALDATTQDYFSRKAGMKAAVVTSVNQRSQNQHFHQKSVPLIRREEFANLKKLFCLLIKQE